MKRVYIGGLHLVPTLVHAFGKVTVIVSLEINMRVAQKTKYCTIQMCHSCVCNLMIISHRTTKMLAQISSMSCTLSNIRRHPRYTSTDKEIRKLWYVHIRKFHLSIKKSEVLTLAENGRMESY